MEQIQKYLQLAFFVLAIAAVVVMVVLQIRSDRAFRRLLDEHSNALAAWCAIGHKFAPGVDGSDAP